MTYQDPLPVIGAFVILMVPDWRNEGYGHIFQDIIIMISSCKYSFNFCHQRGDLKNIGILELRLD